MLFEPKRNRINVQYRSILSARTAYIRFIRFFLLIAILCDISPIYSAIVNHGSWVYILYKCVMVILLGISFVGFVNDKWRGPVFFCGAMTLSTVVYAAEAVLSFVNGQPKVGKTLIVILVIEVLILLLSWSYFCHRRLLFKPNYPHLTAEEQKAVDKEAKIAAEVKAKRAADPFGLKKKTGNAKKEKADRKSGPDTMETPSTKSAPQDAPAESDDPTSDDAPAEPDTTSQEQ